MTHHPPTRRWRASSLALIFLSWLVLQLGGIFSPGLLDDVDSVYIQIAREMLQRHDFITPTIDGIRFFDKPPLMYWMAAASMRLFGVHDWAARLPLALGVLALLLALYALGIRLFSPTPYSLLPTPCPSDRAGLYAALATATALGPYLYTRFYIPDILIALWMTLAVHLFLIALDRVVPQGFKYRDPSVPQGFSLGSHGPAEEVGALAPRVCTPSPLFGFGHSGPSVPQGFSLGSHSPAEEGGALAPGVCPRSPLLPMLGFAAVLALSLLTKGLIGIVFPLAFVFLYLALTHHLRLLKKLRLVPSTLLFLAIAAPWHIMAALRNPAIAMPPGLGLPARAGWAWFYLYNEHIARFLGRRIPHDYGNVPVPLFWLLLLLWLLPWVAFLPAALWNALRTLKKPYPLSPIPYPLSLLLWAGIILGFFTLSSRQEYYHIPALPALALLVAGLLASADSGHAPARKQALRGALWFLVPLGALLFLVCGYLALTAPTPAPGVTLTDLLSSNPDLYNLSLGHVFDLTGKAMGFFRLPLATVALGFLALGPAAYLVRRRGNTFAANLLIAAAMATVLLAAHAGLSRFYPILGSKDLALAIDAQLRPGDLIVIDGELTSGSTLLFYTPQRPEHVLLVNGRINGPWFGSFWPDAPPIFPTDAGLHHLWSGPRRIFLLTYNPQKRTADLAPFAPVHTLATSGGKTVLTNSE